MFRREPLVVLCTSTMYGTRRGAKLSHATDALHIQGELNAINKGEHEARAFQVPGCDARQDAAVSWAAGRPPPPPVSSTHHAPPPGGGWCAGAGLAGHARVPGRSRTPASWLND